MSKKILLSSPHMGGHEMGFIQSAFKNNWIAPMGENVEGFEKDLELYLGEETRVAALTTGTAAIHLALVMCGVEKDDFVICQSLTFAASANPIIYLGATPVFVGSEEETWNLCPEAVEDAIKYCIKEGKLPKAIIAVSLYGMPYQVDEIRNIANRYGVFVIEDSAEALGSCYKGRKSGTFGDFSIISFNGNKIITTSGGGALVSHSDAVKKQIIHLSTQAKDDFEHYEHSKVGYNYRMSNICAGIGRGQMRVLDERVKQKRINHNFYKNLFENFEEINLFDEPSSDFFSNHWLNVITINDLKRSNKNFDSKSIRSQLSHNNIDSRPIWKPMNIQPIFRNYKFFGSNFAERLFENGICLPSGTNLTDEQRSKISVVFKQILKL